MSKITINSNFMGFFEILTFIFVIAKITGYVAWSWWWVFAPIPVHFALILGLLFIVIIKA